MDMSIYYDHNHNYKRNLYISPRSSYGYESDSRIRQHDGLTELNRIIDFVNALSKKHSKLSDDHQLLTLKKENDHLRYLNQIEKLERKVEWLTTKIATNELREKEFLEKKLLEKQLLEQDEKTVFESEWDLVNEDPAEEDPVEEDLAGEDSFENLAEENLAEQ